jgi:hypothetical protein
LIARTGEPTAVVEGSVDSEHGVIGQHLGKRDEESSDLLPAHDVQRVGRECGVERSGRPRTADVERERLRQIGEPRFFEPEADSRQIRLEIGGLPQKLRQRGGEVHRVLPGAAADLEHTAPIGEISP